MDNCRKIQHFYDIFDNITTINISANNVLAKYCKSVRKLEQSLNMGLKLILTVFIAASILVRSKVSGQSDVDCTVLNTIDDIQMTVVGTNLFVTWQEPSNAIACGFTNIGHEVTYTGYQSEQSLTTTNFFAIFEYYPYPCVPSVITIKAYTSDIISEVSESEYYIDSNIVDNLSISDDEGVLVASWSEPEDSELCDFIYLVTYSDSQRSFTVQTSNLTVNLNVEVTSCVLSTVTVTPVDKIYAGIPSTTSYEGAINEVRNYELMSTDGEVLAIFDPPSNIENCEITYEVKETPQDCYVRTVEVAATNGRIYGPWVADNIEVEVSAVRDLTASINEGTVQINWQEPDDASSCEVTYQVAFSSVIYTTSSSSITLTASVPACVLSTVQVTPISNTGKLGVSSEVQLQGELNTVQNLIIENDDYVNASWNPPADSSACVLSYMLEYRDASGVHWYVTEDTSYSFNYISCAVDVTLKVTPYSEDGTEGADATVTLAASC